MHQSQRRADGGRGVYIAANHAQLYLPQADQRDRMPRRWSRQRPWPAAWTRSRTQPAHDRPGSRRRTQCTLPRLQGTGMGETRREAQGHIRRHSASSVALATLAIPNFSHTTRTKRVTPALPSFSPSQPYLVLWDTLCYCEAHGMRPKNKGNIRRIPPAYVPPTELGAPGRRPPAPAPLYSLPLPTPPAATTTIPTNTRHMQGTESYTCDKPLSWDVKRPSTRGVR